MPTLVTGGTGFIGAELLRQMLAGERDVTVFDISPDLGRLKDLGEMSRSSVATWAPRRTC